MTVGVSRLQLFLSVSAMPTVFVVASVGLYNYGCLRKGKPVARQGRKAYGPPLGGSRVAEKERFVVYSALVSRFSKAVLTMVRRVRGTLKHVLSGPATRRFWQLIGKKAALSLEKIRRIATLSTAMAVLAILLFVGIVLGYI
jgi:hypothetical protein